MDIKKLKQSIAAFFQKYKYAVFIFALGIVFMLLPSQSSTKEEVQAIQTPLQPSVTVQEELEEVLSYIQGAGAVKVMLTVASGEQTVYQKNEDSTISDTSTSIKTEVVTVTDADRNEVGLIQQINPPRYLGAIILCQGADDPAVKLAISNAVSKITGLGTDRIAVLKMK